MVVDRDGACFCMLSYGDGYLVILWISRSLCVIGVWLLVIVRSIVLSFFSLDLLCVVLLFVYFLIYGFLGCLVGRLGITIG